MNLYQLCCHDCEIRNKRQQNVFQIVCFVPLMVFNATYTNISAILWQSFLLLDETEGSRDVLLRDK
jgi:hypothetical protein